MVQENNNQDLPGSTEPAARLSSGASPPRSDDGGKMRERRRQILQAASQVFRAKGFHEAGMRQIAADLGMTVGNLYYYFRSKQDLLAFCQEDSLRRLLRIAATIERLDLEPAQRLWLFIYGHINCLNESIPGSLAHLEVESLEDEDRDRIMELRDCYERKLCDIIANGMRRGVFREVDVKTSALAVFGAINWTVKWFRPDGRLPLRTIAESFASQLTLGLLADGVRLEAPLREIAVVDVGAEEFDGV